MPKIDMLRVMGEDDFEDMVNEWAHGNIKITKYKEIKHFGGAGDKGRDVVGYYDNDTIDIFQCKHYKNPIAPTTMYPELAKLCYFTFTSIYPIPRSYCIISPHGLGPDMSDLLKNPTAINQRLIDNWTQYCEGIAKPKIKLEGAFKLYVETFDFSILIDKSPLKFIEEHEATVYHARRFGGLRAYRVEIPKAEKDIQLKELIYITQLFSVYSEELSQKINDASELKTLSEELFENLNSQRNSFYSAESLERFSRDNYPDADPFPFDELKEDALTVVNNCLLLNKRDKALDKLLKSIQEILRADFSANPLSLNGEIKNIDKQGICHHLVNDSKVKWIK